MQAQGPQPTRPPGTPPMEPPPPSRIPSHRWVIRRERPP